MDISPLSLSLIYPIRRGQGGKGLVRENPIELVRNFLARKFISLFPNFCRTIIREN